MIVIIMIKDGEGARTCPISFASGLAPHQHAAIFTCPIIISTYVVYNCLLHHRHHHHHYYTHFIHNIEMRR